MGLINKIKNIFKQEPKIKPTIAIVGRGKEFYNTEDWKRVNEEIKEDKIQMKGIDDLRATADAMTMASKEFGLSAASIIAMSCPTIPQFPISVPRISKYHRNKMLLYGLTLEQAKIYGRINAIALKHKKGRKHKKAINRMAYMLDKSIGDNFFFGVDLAREELG